MRAARGTDARDGKSPGPVPGVDPATGGAPADRRLAELGREAELTRLSNAASVVIGDLRSEGMARRMGAVAMSERLLKSPGLDGADLADVMDVFVASHMPACGGWRLRSVRLAGAALTANRAAWLPVLMIDALASLGPGVPTEIPRLVRLGCRNGDGAVSISLASDAGAGPPPASGSAEAFARLREMAALLGGSATHRRVRGAGVVVVRLPSEVGRSRRGRRG